MADTQGSGVPGSSTPEIVAGAEQPYMAIRAQVTLAELPALAARFGELFGWLGAHGLVPAGPPFFRYNVIDMERELDMEAGVPVTASVGGEGAIGPGVLPAGRYATVVHVGHPKELMMATKDLLDWGAGQGLKWDISPGEHGDRWGSRPSQEPDMSKWRTQLAFRLAD
jgi:effector-binding domain-containing protein